VAPEVIDGLFALFGLPRPQGVLEPGRVLLQLAAKQRQPRLLRLLASLSRGLRPWLLRRPFGRLPGLLAQPLGGFSRGLRLWLLRRPVGRLPGLLAQPQGTFGRGLRPWLLRRPFGRLPGLLAQPQGTFSRGLRPWLLRPFGGRLKLLGAFRRGMRLRLVGGLLEPPGAFVGRLAR
jgi:hypothetical protein